MTPTQQTLAFFVTFLLLSTPLAGSDVIISEFMASNQTTLEDEDGDSSDWIEIKNRGAETVLLQGWSLTDDPTELQKWRFPSVELTPGEYLLVFASGKDRSVAGAELHTNFALRAGGEYVALVRPDGSVVSEYGPSGASFPEQLGDISYGLFEATRETSLVVSGDVARTWVPTDGALGDAWTGGDRNFDDSGWSDGTTSIGYETEEPQEPSVKLTLTDDLVLWLDATAGVTTDPFGHVEHWQDQLVGENTVADDAVQIQLGNRPLLVEGGSPLGDRPVVRFGGTESDSRATWLEVPHRAELNPGTGGWTVFVVGFQTNASGLWIGKGNEEPEDDGYSIYGRFNRLYVRAGTGEGADPLTRGAQRGSLPRDLAVISAELTGEEIRGYRDGDASGFSSGGGGIEDNTVEGEISNSSPIRIGAWKTVDLNLEGDLAEILIYKRQLSPEERMTVEAYLSDKWFLPAEEIAPNYGELIGTDVGSRMLDANASIYLRIPFRLEGDPSTFDELTLKMQYDDGFIAYLNGVEVARRNAPELATWNSSAASVRPDTEALVFKTLNIASFVEHLLAGDNLLAIHGLNVAPGDDDFLLGAALSAATVTPAVSYFPNPTPGSQNGDGVLGFLEPPELSVERGFYDAPFELRMTTRTTGARLLYTTDGSRPTLANGIEYTEPLMIETTAVIRARSFLEGYLPSAISTSSYIFLDHVTSQTGAGLPSGGQLRGDYTLDERVYDDPLYRDGFVDALKSLPTMSLVLDAENDFFGPSGIYANPLRSGRASERETSVEWMVPDGSEEGFQVDAGIRIHGGAGRDHPKLSFRLYFRSEYGARRLNYPVHPDSPVGTYERLVLRAGFNDSYVGGRFEPVEPQYLRDQFTRQIHHEMGHLHSHWRYIHLYINGLYWGLYDVTERMDGAFASDHLGEPGPDDWDVMKHGDEIESEALQGDRQAWDEAQALANRGLESAEAYAEFQDLVDVVSLADYALLNIHIGSTDWPQRNWYALRPRVDGGRFFFAVWDAELTMNMEELAINRTAVQRADTTGRLYARCSENAEFRLLFADRVHRYFFNGGLLTPEVVTNRYLSIAEKIEEAIVCESARWGDLEGRRTPETRETWRRARDRLVDVYFPRRTDIVFEQVRNRGLYTEAAAPTFSQHGGGVRRGFVLGVSAPAGSIYLTLDGTDPRRPILGDVSEHAILVAGSLEPALPLLSAGAEVRVLVPTDGSLGLEWTQLDFDDTSWTVGQTGVGYERSEGYEAVIATDLEERMFDINASVYLRQEFTVDGPLPHELTLRMKYDDGYVAYINGQVVASKNAPDSPAWNSQAVRGRVDAQALVFEDVSVSVADGLLQPGRNLLAIHGFNRLPRDSDLLILPELRIPPPAAEGSVIIERSGVVRARARVNNEWSALNEAKFSVGAANLRITEIMYHPPAPQAGSPFADEDFEYVEIQNVASQPVNLMGVRLAGGIEFSFEEEDLGPEYDLAPGEFVLIVKDFEAFASRYGTAGLTIAGEYERRLSNAADRLVLLDPMGETVLDFTYEDWFPQTDGGGRSLEIVDPLAAPETWGNQASWEPSADLLGSPGRGVLILLEGGAQRPGDVNQDGVRDLSDAVRLLEHLFLDQKIDPLPCDGESVADSANGALIDLNGDTAVNISDVITILKLTFGGGQAPAVEECVRIVGCPDLGCQ